MNTQQLLHYEIEHTQESILREVYHYLLFLKTALKEDDGRASTGAIDEVSGIADDEPPHDPYQLGVDLFDRGGPSAPPSDPLKRQIWERLHAKYAAR